MTTDNIMTDEELRLRCELNRLRGALTRMADGWERSRTRNAGAYREGYEDALDQCSAELRAAIGEAQA
jgi:uncharacterized protein YukE